MLNEAQRLAVDTIEGPVMVVAGPGTGKTQVLAVRVANILRRQQVNPSNILCLTFSNSGATAMRDRLRKMIGADAYRITIETIHGFCNSIIASHPSVFERWSSAHQISDVERYRLVNAIIDELMPDMALLNPKSPYDRTDDILARITELKREGVSDPERLRDIVAEFEERMAGKSREGTKAHAENLSKARKFKELVEIFLRYQAKLKETSRYDYDDMILYVIAALREEDWLLASLQERYQYVLVDEFQDTNGAQQRVIELLTTDPTPEKKPNLFVVGDDDQAIYRFQGASIKTLLTFRDRFPGAPIIALTESYRCTQPILDAAGALIANNTERLTNKIDGLSKNLRAQSPGGESPKMLYAPSDTAEPWLIADLVQERLDAGIAPEEIAVLTQTNAELPPLYEALRSRNIPVVLTGKLDLLQHPIVQQALAILKAIESPRSSQPLADALACPCFGLHPADRAELHQARLDRGITLLEVLLDLDGNHPLQLRRLEKTLAVRDLLLDLSQQIPIRTVLQTIEQVYRQCGLLNDLERGNLDLIDFAAAQEFFNRVEQRALETPGFTFNVLLSDLAYYENPEYGSVRLSYDLPHLTKSGVQLMTAHKSKGLEFHTVILANFREGHWSNRRPRHGISVPEDLLYGWEKEQKAYERSQDERRVAYVAMTRAKHELLFVGPRELTTGDSMKRVSPSAFFAEAGTLPEEDRDVRDPSTMSTLLSTPARSLDEEFEAYLRHRIEHFALSYSSLRDFLEDPDLFVKRHLLRHPEPKDPAFAYGNAVHHALAAWAQGLADGRPLTQSEFLERFVSHLESKEILTDAERARLVHVGKEALPRYFASRMEPPYPVIHKVEYAIATHVPDPSDTETVVPIKGKIDRIELLEPSGRGAIVRDFKTGRPKTEAECRESGYGDQMTFYAVLLEEGYKLIDAREFILDFIGEREAGAVERPMSVSEDDKRRMRELIARVWSKIVALDFTRLTPDPSPSAPFSQPEEGS